MNEDRDTSLPQLSCAAVIRIASFYCLPTDIPSLTQIALVARFGRRYVREWMLVYLIDMNRFANTLESVARKWQ